jgi:hypothetical protein
MWTRFLICCLMALPSLCMPADARKSGCTLLAGGGRMGVVHDAQADEIWNRVNFSFFDATLTAWGTAGEVVPAFFPIGSADAAKMADSILAQAAKAGCSKLAIVSVFSDDSGAQPEVVFVLRVSPIVRRAGPASASVGAADYEREYRFAATSASLDKVVPSRIAERAVRDYETRQR